MRFTTALRGFPCLHLL